MGFYHVMSQLSVGLPPSVTMTPARGQKDSVGLPQNCGVIMV